MAAIRKLGSNRFQLDFTIFGHRIRTNFFEEAHALDFRKRLLAALPDHPFTIEQSIQVYLRNETDKRKTKQSRIMERYWFYELRQFLKTKGLSPESLISELKQFHIVEFQTHLTEKGSSRGRKLTNSSVNRRFHTFKNFFSRLQEWGFVRVNPAEHLRQLPEKINRRAKWSDQDISKALTAGTLPPLEHDLFLFLLRTGVRLGSACGMLVGDVVLDRSLIIVRQRKGTGAESSFSIPIPVSIREIVEKRLTSKSEDFLFRDHRGCGLYPGFYSKRFSRHFAKAGLTHVQLHGLRHTFASTLSAAGASTESVRRLLGHSSGKTTENYLHLDLDQLRKWVG